MFSKRLKRSKRPHLRTTCLTFLPKAKAKVWEDSYNLCLWLPVTSEASTSVQLQVSQTPVLTTKSTPKSTSSSLPATAPSFSPEAGQSPPTQGEVPSYENVTSVRNPPVTSFFSGSPPIISAMVTPLPHTSRWIRKDMLTRSAMVWIEWHCH